jgi:hypothetical protein
MRRSRWIATAAIAVGLLSAVSGFPGITPASAAGEIKGAYTAITPVRILDTRNDACLPDGGRIVQVTGPIANVPLNAGAPVVSSYVPTGSVAVALNVTAVGATAPGWITVWPDGAKPLTSNLNYVASSATPNMVLAKLDGTGKLRIAGQGGCPNGIIDVVGYFNTLEPGTTPDASGFKSLPPKRIMDTRLANDGLESGSAIAPTGCASPTPKSLDVTNVGGVPADGVKAVALNVTASGASGPSWLTVYPGDVPAPEASNVNFGANQAVPNMVIVEVPATGIVKIVSPPGGCPNVIVDVVGWWKTGAPPGLGGIEGVTPKRIFDTRATTGDSAPDPALNCVGTTEAAFKVTGKGDVPAAAADVAAVALNVTTTDATTNGFLTVWGSTDKPGTSNLNFPSGAKPIANMVIAQVNSDGKVKVASDAGCPEVIVDVVGWFAKTDLKLEASPSTATFPIAAHATATDVKDVTINNTSAYADTATPTFTFTGVDAGQFDDTGTTCTVPLAATTGTCKVTITWTPGGAAGAITATDAQLVITSGFGTTVVELEGTRPA